MRQQAVKGRLIFGYVELGMYRRVDDYEAVAGEGHLAGTAGRLMTS